MSSSNEWCTSPERAQALKAWNALPIDHGKGDFYINIEGFSKSELCSNALRVWRQRVEGDNR